MKKRSMEIYVTTSVAQFSSKHFCPAEILLNFEVFMQSGNHDLPKLNLLLNFNNSNRMCSPRV